MTHGVSATLTNSRISAPYGSPMHRRPPAGDGLGCVGKTDRKRMVGWDPRGAEPAAGDLNGGRVVAQEIVCRAGSGDAGTELGLRVSLRSGRAGRHSGRRR